MNMRVVGHQVLYSDPHFFSSFPGVTMTPDGPLVVFRRARDHRWMTAPGRGLSPKHPDFDSVDHIDSRSEIVRMSLDGNMTPTGQPVALPADPEAADQDGNIITLRDGRLMQYSFMWYPMLPEYMDAVKGWKHGFYVGNPDRTGVVYLFWGAYVRFSTDVGITWGERILLPTPRGMPDIIPGKRKSYGGALRGRAVELDDGALVIATYHGKPEAKWKTFAYSHRSTDGGATWTYAGRIAGDPKGELAYFEPGLAALPDGRVIAFFRTGGRDDHLVTCTSKDGGFRWSKPKQHTVKGHPFDPVVLPGGRIFLVYGYRHKPMGIRARVIDPDMDDYGDAPECILRDDGPTRDVGYPSAVSLDVALNSDGVAVGRVGAVYYYADKKGVRHIASTVVEITS